MLRRDEFQISSTNQAYDVLITDGSVPVNFPDWLHDGDRQSIFIDQDGSVTGRPPVGNQKAVITNRAQFLKLGSCIDTRCACLVTLTRLTYALCAVRPPAR